jgi:AcrR family transcriptional regulator
MIGPDAENLVTAILLSRKPRPEPYLEKQLRKYQALLLAGWQEFVAKGFHNTKIQDITRRAGVAKGTFYLYFRDKHDLLETIVNAFFETGLEWIEMAIRKAESERATATETLTAVVKQQLTLLFTHRDVTKFLFFDLSYQPESRFPSKSGLRDRYYATVGSVLAKGIQNGEFRDDLNIHATVTALEGSIYWNIYLSMIAQRTDIDISQIVNDLINIYVHGLHPSCAGRTAIP